jgi:hypothetical protein
MGVEHDGMTIAFHRHCCVSGLSHWRLFFPQQMNGASRKEKFLKPPWIWKKGGEDFSIRLAPNQKTVQALQKACSDRVIEKAHHEIPLNPPLLKGETPVASL